MVDENSSFLLEYQPSEFNLLLVILAVSLALILLLLSLCVLFWGCFVLMGGPDPMKEYQSTCSSYFIGSLFTALILGIIITLLLAVAFTRTSRHQAIAPSYACFLAPSAMITSGILLLVPFMLSSPIFLFGFCVWDKVTATTIGISFLCTSVVGAVLAVMGFVRLSHVRHTPI